MKGLKVIHGHDKYDKDINDFNLASYLGFGLNLTHLIFLLLMWQVSFTFLSWAWLCHSIEMKLMSHFHLFHFYVLRIGIEK